MNARMKQCWNGYISKYLLVFRLWRIFLQVIQIYEKCTQGCVDLSYFIAFIAEAGLSYDLFIL